MKRFKYRSDMVKLGSFSDGTSSRIENKLKAICLYRKKPLEKQLKITLLFTV